MSKDFVKIVNMFNDSVYHDLSKPCLKETIHFPDVPIGGKVQYRSDTINSKSFIGKVFLSN